MSIGEGGSSLGVGVYLSHRGHHLNAQLWRGGRYPVDLPNVSHELCEESPDVRPMLDVGAACENVLAPQFPDHPAR